MFYLEEKDYQQVIKLIQENRKIEAIKYVVERSNLGLKESKEFIDQLQNDFTLRLPKSNLQEDLSTAVAQDIDMYSKIQINHSTEKVLLLSDIGHNVEIDERHFLWKDAMQKFGRKAHASKKEYLQYLSQWDQPAQPQKIQSTQERNPQIQGIEQHKQKTNRILIILVIFIIILVIIFVLK